MNASASLSASQKETTATSSRHDRFAVLAVILITVTAVGLGILLIKGTSSQVWTYESREAGIETVYPAGWLTDEQGNYVVRIRDPKARPFKTQFILQVVPTGGITSVRNILDGLTLQRAADLSAYRVLNVIETGIDGQALTEMNFAFVDADPNPFIQRLPVVVLGRDIVILDGERAIIVTYMADQASFDEDLPRFERLLDTLQY